MNAVWLINWPIESRRFDGERIERLTIASIVVAGLAGIVSGGVGLAAKASVAGDAAEVTRGLLASWLGVSALYPFRGGVSTDRNPLQKIWTGPQGPHIFFPHRVAFSADCCLDRTTAFDAAIGIVIVGGMKPRQAYIIVSRIN